WGSVSAEELERGLADCRTEGDVDRRFRTVGANEGCVLALSEWEKIAEGSASRPSLSETSRTGSGETARESDPALLHHGQREGRGGRGCGRMERMTTTAS